MDDTFNFDRPVSTVLSPGSLKNDRQSAALDIARSL